MTILSGELAICPKCGNKQVYIKVTSWNKGLNPNYPGRNICYKCGAKISYKDIDLSICSPQHRREARRFQIYNEMRKSPIFFTGVLGKLFFYITELKLIRNGIITTRKEEKEYEEKYYGELNKKYGINKGEKNNEQS